MTTKGIYHTLVTQLDKLARHNRQGSFRTKDRYYEAVKRFCAYLAAHYHLQKLDRRFKSVYRLCIMCLHTKSPILSGFCFRNKGTIIYHGRYFMIGSMQKSLPKYFKEKLF